MSEHKDHVLRTFSYIKISKFKCKNRLLSEQQCNTLHRSAFSISAKIIWHTVSDCFVLSIAMVITFSCL